MTPEKINMPDINKYSENKVLERNLVTSLPKSIISACFLITYISCSSFSTNSLELKSVFMIFNCLQSSLIRIMQHTSVETEAQMPKIKSTTSEAKRTAYLEYQNVKCRLAWIEIWILWIFIYNSYQGSVFFSIKRTKTVKTTKPEACINNEVFEHTSLTVFQNFSISLSLE